MPTEENAAPIQKEGPALIRVIFQMEKTNWKRNQDEKKETKKERKEERKLIRGERKLSGERERVIRKERRERDPGGERE